MIPQLSHVKQGPQYLTEQFNSAYEVVSKAIVPSPGVLRYHNQQQDPALCKARHSSREVGLSYPPELSHI